MAHSSPAAPAAPNKKNTMPRTGAGPDDRIKTSLQIDAQPEVRTREAC
jgi:hypothetical protein